MLRDVWFAIRMLARSPGFAAIAILSMALSIGAGTALFSLTDAMLLRALPVAHPEDLVEFVSAAPTSMFTNLPHEFFEVLRGDHTVLSAVFALQGSDLALRAGDSSEQARIHAVSGSYFPALGVPPLLGRAIGPGDDQRGAANHVVVISDAFWSRQFGRDPSILGSGICLSGERYTIAGIMPPGFIGVDRGNVPDLWIPLAADPHPGDLWILGRLRPGVSVAQARAQLEPLFHRVLEQQRGLESWPERQRKEFLSQRLLLNRAADGTSTLRWTYWDYSGTLKIPIGLTALVILIACANLANLLTARSASRSKEIGIRLALGAGRGRLVRQLMTENLLLGLAGGVAGVVIASWGHRLMLGFLAEDEIALHYRLDLRVLGFALALSLATAVLFGLTPAIRATAIVRRGTSNLPVAKAALALQIGFSLVLLTGAGLFARSLSNLGSADLGLARDNLLLVDVGSPRKPPQARQEFWQALLSRVSALPGVQSASLAGNAAFGNGGWNQVVWLNRSEGQLLDAKVSMNLVSPGFFATVGIPLVAGREFGDQDHPGSPGVVIVNRTFAQRFFPNQNPIGKRFSDSNRDAQRYEIVAVVEDAKYGSIRERIEPMAYYPLWQKLEGNSYVLHVRTAIPPAAAMSSVRRQVLAMDSETTIGAARTLPQVVREQSRQDRMFATLATFFALLALVLSAIGIYGIVAFGVTRRTAEIGIRMALGAKRRDVLWLIQRETLLLLAAGAMLGVPAALAAARLLRSRLFGLAPSDPLTFVCATLTLLIIGSAAGFFPARRAASVDPALAIKNSLESSNF
ncbi:MAG TPA: ABC transporter permease [Bryobacteraceae bacterium]|nr:ABC transporter permease [Bryobacteraceae bacterium]